MTTDEKIAAMLAAHPPVLRDANPVCICVCSVAIVFELGAAVKKKRFSNMNYFHTIYLVVASD
jgi:hypothetical protein